MSPHLQDSTTTPMNHPQPVVETEFSATDEPGIPLSFAQERLWFLDQLHPNNSLYNVPSAIRMRGRLDPVALKKSLEAIVERHEILRTTYRLVNGSPVQEITDSFRLDLPVVDLSGTREGQRPCDLQTHLSERARQPFDLARDLMVRAVLFKLGADEHVLLLNIHHIACDEWSMGIFFKELTILYKGFVTNRPATLDEPSVQYADY
ncbi:MAG: condensation domain-containing protein, partial [Limisphaerales bacterium]